MSRARFAVVSVATAFTMAATASLGLWQLDRARQKTELQAAMLSRAEQPALGNAELLAKTDDAVLVHRSVQLQGRWLPQHSVFLENRQMNGRTGFFLVTPLRLSGSERAVLVQRGWLPRDFNDRTRVPDVTTLPLLMFNASMGGNYQIASITALLLLIPSIAFMLVVERFLKADVLASVGK